jgi:hypothetical protein
MNDTGRRRLEDRLAKCAAEQRNVEIWSLPEPRQFLYRYIIESETPDEGLDAVFLAYEDALAHLHTLADSAPDQSPSLLSIYLLIRAAKIMGAFEGLGFGMVPHAMDEALTKALDRRNGKKGVPKSIATRQAKQAERWADGGLAIAKKYVASHPKYSQDALASHIEHMLDPPVTHGRIKNVIREWQRDGKISKKAR